MAASSRSRRRRSATRSRASCSTSCSTSPRAGSPRSARRSRRRARRRRSDRVTPGRTLVLASGNPHKLTELRRALAGWEIELVGARDPPPEDGATYEDNARIKARWGAAHAPPSAWAVGEDSGIEALALEGRPGV